MPLSASGLTSALKPEIKSAIQDAFGVPANAEQLDKFCQAMASAIASKVIDHFKTNADVLPGSFSNAGGGVSGTGKIT